MAQFSFLVVVASGLALAKTVQYATGHNVDSQQRLQTLYQMDYTAINNG